jgi:hypothetical protein
MQIGEITKSETIYELEKWAKSSISLLELSDGVSAEKVSKSIMQKAIAKFKKQPEPTDERLNDMEEYMANLEMKLGSSYEEKEEKSTLKKFFSFFRAHPRLIGLGVIILMLLSPLLPSIAVVGLTLEKILSVILAGLYTIDIASPAVKTAMEL